ncbi:MAG: hypothetical protein JWN00_1442 [Actinomycetia bacterium]|nr:hypothetical protein [Actinomycetes bacterium]
MPGAGLAVQAGHADPATSKVASTHLYDLDAAACELAVGVGATIRAAGHSKAVALAGHPNVVETMSITPLFSRTATKVGRNMISNRTTTDRYETAVIATYRT